MLASNEIYDIFHSSHVFILFFFKKKKTNKSKRPVFPARERWMIVNRWICFITNCIVLKMQRTQRYSIQHLMHSIFIFREHLSRIFCSKRCYKVDCHEHKAINTRRCVESFNLKQRNRTNAPQTIQTENCFFQFNLEIASFLCRNELRKTSEPFLQYFVCKEKCVFAFS